MGAVGVADVQTVVLGSVGSTNDEVLNLEGDWCLVTADEQTAGRGRLERTWTSPFAAGIAMSLAVKRAQIETPLPSVPLIAGLAVVDALSVIGCQATLKWPNDVLLHGDLKVGGILVQLVADRIVVGIGLNVSLSEDELPTAQSTSLHLAGFCVDREPLIAQIVSNVRTGISSDSWHGRYAEVCSTIGREIRVTALDGGFVVGTCVGITSDGALMLREGDEIRHITVGDVQHIRPATE
jgi:BirA family biotin operon repressor/biotin-[acetyl-CoA-carboxylase] ligase